MFSLASASLPRHSERQILRLIWSAPGAPLDWSAVGEPTEAQLAQLEAETPEDFTRIVIVPRSLRARLRWHDRIARALQEQHARKHPKPWVIPAVMLERGDNAEQADLLLRVLCQRYEKESLVSYRRRMYGYRFGTFEAIEEDDLDRIVKHFGGVVTLLKGEDGVKQLAVNAASGAVKFAHTEVSDQQFFDSAAKGIAFTDGFVIVEPNRLRKVAHSPKHRARQAYPFAFDGPRVREPKLFLKFLDDVFRDDADRVEKIAALQEFMGAAITGLATKYERALVLFGAGSNGKTRLTAIIEAVMPPGSAVALPPSLWGDQYQRPLLEGACLNCVPDLTTDELGSAVKGVITGEGVAARSPGGKAASFKPTAAHVFGCNKLPKTTDTSDGFWRRWLILPMTRSFLNDPSRDVGIHHKIIAQDLPGIMRWALEGAARLRGKAEYTLPPSHDLMIGRWRGKDDAVRLFIEARTRPSVAGERGTQASALHAAFTTWGKAYGVDMTDTAFGLALTGMGLAGKRGAKGVRYMVELLAV